MMTKGFQLFLAVVLISNFSCGQNKYTVMKSSTATLVKNLKKCDTSKILKMFDTSFSQITKSNYRNFIKETILDQCHFFNIVINKYGQPNLSKLKFTKDTLNGANIAVLLLMNKKDSGLSVEESSLVIFFYPDNFFNYKSNQFLNFSIQKKFIRPKQSILIQQIDQKGRKNSP